MRSIRTWTWGASRFQTIRYRLAGALILAVLPVLLLGVAESIDSFHREAAHQRNDLTASAERSTANARARIESAIAVLKTLEPEAPDNNCDLRLRVLTHELSGYEAFARYDAEGRLICASDRAHAPPNVAATTWFERVRHGEDRVLARASPDAGLPGPALMTAVRDDSGRRFSGALVAVTPLSTLSPTVDGDALPSGAAVAVTDETGAILSATDHQAFQHLRTSWITKLGKRGTTLFYAHDPSGQRRVYAGARLAGDDVYVLLSAPTEGPFSWARLNPVATVVLPLLLWVLAIAAVLVVSERVVIRWLDYLERIAQLYAKGRFSVRPVQARSAPLEIRNLAITLDQMADGIERRDTELRESIEHKDALMREIHHRVKNNLQVISSLLNMQQRSLTDPAARAAMGDTRQRIAALALIYRALYQSPDLRRVDVRLFLEELIAQLVSNDAGRGGAAVRTELSADTLVIDPDKLAPLALWAVEAISNAQKHAFATRGGALSVRFSVGPQTCALEVEDDGPGVDKDTEGLGLGRKLMTAFARQLRGDSEMLGSPRGGCVARLSFPSPEQPLDQQTVEESTEGNPAAA